VIASVDSRVKEYAALQKSELGPSSPRGNQTENAIDPAKRRAASPQVNF
jgi:hypothetical protein